MKMRVLFISGREGTYTRNAVLIKGLRANGVEVIECTSAAKTYPGRYARNVMAFIRQDPREYDAIFVGFFGQPLVHLLKKVTKKKILFDAFISAYDTMCFERGRFHPASIAGRTFSWLDRRSCTLADRIITDTAAHIDYFADTFGIAREKFDRVFVGADESLFHPGKRAGDDRRFTVFYSTGYLPLHGVEHIVSAAKLLEHEPDISFQIVGNGPVYPAVTRYARSLQVKNVTFTGLVPYQDLPSLIAGSDVCLGGHFSGIDKSRRVIAGKTFQFVAMGRPVIVGDNPANRELFEDGRNAVMARHADPESIAEAVLLLRDDIPLCGRIARNGHDTFQRCCTTGVLGRQVRSILEAMLQDTGGEWSGRGRPRTPVHSV